MLIYTEIKTQIGYLVERVDSSYLTKVDGWCNQRWEDIVSRRPWMALLRQLQFTCTAGQNYIILPQEVAQVIDVHQRETPIVMALRRYYNRLRRDINSMTDSGSPTELNPMGIIGVKAALPSTGTITVESASAADTTQKVRVHGYNSDKLPITELITLNGTSAVTSTNSYSSAEGYEPTFSKDGATAGVITIKRSSTVICEIAPREMYSRYRKWLIFPTPSAATVLYTTFKKTTRRLEYDEDVPDIECANALIHGAFAQALQKKRQFQKAQDEWQLYEQAIAVLEAMEPKFDENFNDQWFPIINRNPIDLPYQ